MTTEQWLERFVEALLRGCRDECRKVVADALEAGLEAETLYRQMMAPALERIARMYRADEINVVTEHLAARIHRQLVDQLQVRLTRAAPNGKRIVIMCADGEPEELGAQMCADLFEAQGWEVYFVGGGVPNDEILALVGGVRPEILLIVGTQPAGVTGVRRLIDLIREVNANPTMNVLISGGVFNRAEGLWKEVNADLFAPTGSEALEIARVAVPRTPEVRVPGAPKKRRRRRRPPLLAAVEA